MAVCEGCRTPDTGWSKAHLIVTTGGLIFCSRSCMEAWEEAHDQSLSIKRESGFMVKGP